MRDDNLFQEQPGDHKRRQELRKHKAIATGLLLFVTCIYMLCRYAESTGEYGSWVHYLRAASEAGMVGALADWFAVTVLFKHPLGIPIPHTAIIPRKKDQVGHSLSSFVGDNFLNARLISEKLSQARVPERAAQWVLDNSGAERISHEVGKFIDIVARGINPQDAEVVIRSVLVDPLEERQWSPPLGRGLEQLIREGKIEPAIEACVVWADDKAHQSEELVVTLLDERTPQWAPRFVRDLVGNKVYRELIAFTSDVRANPQHEARGAIRNFLEQLARDLQEDPSTQKRVEQWKKEVLGSSVIQKVPGQLWENLQKTLIAMALDPHSLLRESITRLSREWAQRIMEDAELREKLEIKLVNGAAYLADNYAGEVTSIIGETVERWDAQEASERIELMVGKDLQFIRVNGTIVGALAGLLIYSLSEFIITLF